MAHQADLAKWDPYAAWRYQKDLPADRTDFKPAWELLETYSKILADVIDAHVAVIVTYEVFHYPCLGRWRFFDLWITKAPEYPTLITRLTAGETLLDVGCCFAHVLRQLTADGVPSENLTGTDLQPDFIELGYELFRDKDTLSRGAWFEMPDHFGTGDILDAGDENLASMDEKFDIVHASSFFHLFSWDDQVKVRERIIKFLKPGQEKALMLGRQIGTREPPSREEYRKQPEKRCLHDLESWRGLWNEIGERTGTKWKVDGEIFDSRFDDGGLVFLRFVVSKGFD
ncbi:hypothetical protein BDZ45DRAFT_606858 [Acephala macrosclerotiorum]|nr:hypothetical protein BDZ45DRAFT_606858 [Acephala macrosclerotiorum]